MALSTIDTSSISGLGYGFKNRIINGGMVINQRGGTTTQNTTANVYGIDQWAGYGQITDGVFTMVQSSSSPPAGFSNFLRTTVTTADASIGATQTYGLRTVIEGYNVSDLGWGAAGASTVTMSFWVRSSVTGTFSGAIFNGGNTRFYVFSFAINSANTWEQKTITIAGDTTGTWATDNTAGIKIVFNLGAGSTYSGTAGSWGGTTYYGVTGGVNLISTLNATLDITGVQLEAGTVATSFDWRPYGTELNLCQRYYWKKVGGASGSSYETIASGFIYNTTTSARVGVQYPCSMRAIPTFSTGGTLYMGIGSGNLTPSTITSYAGLNSALIDVAVTSSTIGLAALYYTANTTSDYFQASAEL